MDSPNSRNGTNRTEETASGPPPNGLEESSPKQPARAKKAKPTVITEILPNDILLGRGALAISNEGNVRFRSIIAGRKDEYISTSRRLKKDTIANEIRVLIASRNGRFLRRATPGEKLELELTRGKDAWAVADEEVVVAKIKQSLRDKESEERDVIEQANKRAHETSFEEVKRTRMRGGPPALDWKEPHIATDRPLQPMIRSDFDRNKGESARLPTAQEQILEEELRQLRERQQLLLSRSLMLGGGMPGATNPLARYQQSELLSVSGGVLDSQSLEQRLGALRQSANASGALQDSSRSSQSGQDMETLRREIERRSQIEILLKQREEELFLRRLEQERDASLSRLRRQEALLAAIRQGQPLPDIDAASLLRGGVGADFLRDNNDLLGQSDLLARRQKADLSALLAARGMQVNTSLDPLSQSLLGPNHASLRDDVQFDRSLNRKDPFGSQKSSNDYDQLDGSVKDK